MTTRLRTPRPGSGSRRALRCDRCAAAGVRRYFTRLTAPYWDPTYRLCPACTRALAELFDLTDTWPRSTASAVDRYPTPPDTTGAPHYLHRTGSLGRRAA
jgi:hypothetical protein